MASVLTKECNLEQDRTPECATISSRTENPVTMTLTSSSLDFDTNIVNSTTAALKTVSLGVSWFCLPPPPPDLSILNIITARIACFVLRHNHRHVYEYELFAHCILLHRRDVRAVTASLRAPCHDTEEALAFLFVVWSTTIYYQLWRTWMCVNVNIEDQWSKGRW